MISKKVVSPIQPICVLSFQKGKDIKTPTNRPQYPLKTDRFETEAFINRRCVQVFSFDFSVTCTVVIFNLISHNPRF